MARIQLVVLIVQTQVTQQPPVFAMADQTAIVQRHIRRFAPLEPVLSGQRITARQIPATRVACPSPMVPSPTSIATATASPPCVGRVLGFLMDCFPRRLAGDFIRYSCFDWIVHFVHPLVFTRDCLTASPSALGSSPRMTY